MKAKFPAGGDPEPARGGSRWFDRGCGMQDSPEASLLGKSEQQLKENVFKQGEPAEGRSDKEALGKTPGRWE